MHRVDLLAIPDDLVVAMRACAFACIAHPAYYFAALYSRARPHLNAHHMSVQCLVAIAVIDDDVIAITLLLKTCEGHSAIRRSINGCTKRRRKIKPGVHLRRLVIR